MEKATIKSTKQLLKKSIDANIAICFGKNKVMKKDYKELYKRLVNNIKIINNDEKTETNNGLADGVCKISDKKIEGYSTYSIVIKGLKEKMSDDDREFAIHECIHEFFHFSTNILTEIFSKHNDGIIEDDIIKRTRFGLISMRDKYTGESYDRGNYFKMFNETMMDIMTTMAKSTYIDGECNIERILSGNNLGVKTAYTEMIPLTLLFISAFSNNPNPDYSKKIIEGKGIVRDKTITSKNKKVNTNDFITNSLCDPLLIEKEFDRYTSEGNFQSICYVLDEYYFNNKVNKEAIKIVIKSLSKFVSNKLNDKISKNVFSKEEAYQILLRFNEMFNKTLYYYGINLNEKDISDISKNTIIFNEVSSDGFIKTKKLINTN